MKAKINHVVDYGYKKEFHLEPVEQDTFIQGYISVGEDHPWFGLTAGDSLEINA